MYQFILLQGLHGIKSDVFLSLPCVLGENGVTDIIQQVLTEEESMKLRESADTMDKVIQGLQFQMFFYFVAFKQMQSYDPSYFVKTYIDKHL